jgi:hypothetical protein
MNQSIKERKKRGATRQTLYHHDMSKKILYDEKSLSQKTILCEGTNKLKPTNEQTETRRTNKQTHVKLFHRRSLLLQ